MDRILRPSGVLIVAYGVLSLALLTLYVWKSSLLWFSIPTATQYLVGLLVVLTVGVVVSIILDKKYKWQLKRYFIISLLQLILILSFASSVRTWQVDSSFQKANLIVEPLERYRNIYGEYPSSLTELEQKLQVELPARTNIGTPYWYRLEDRQNYSLSFYSYSGFFAHYDRNRKQWTLAD